MSQSENSGRHHRSIVDRQDLPEGNKIIETFWVTYFLLHSFERKFSRFGGNFASESNLPSSRLAIDDCFQLAVASMNRFGFAEDRKIRTELANFEFLVGNVQMQFYIRGKSAVGFCNHDFSTNRTSARGIPDRE